MSYPERPDGKKTVYFFVQGKFGNNLFQYFAAKILCTIYQFDAVRPTFQMNLEFNHVIDDAKWMQIVRTHREGHTIELDPRKDILLIGFFQRSDVFGPLRAELKALFHAENTDHISNRIRIGNIVKYKSNHTLQLTTDDLTLHLRMGDFWDPVTERSQIFSPEDLKEIIGQIPHQRLFIVCQTPTEDWERAYVAEFNELNPTWINGNLGDDFDFMLRSSKLIVSASTMSYMAAFLGNATEVHLPYNYFYGGEEGTGQHLASFDDSVCHVHWNVRTWIPPHP